MGVNICVFDDSTGQEVPESVWDWYRHAGDRDLARLMVDLPRTAPGSLGDDEPGNEQFRPSDFEAWRKADRERVPQWNASRFKELIDLLETNPNYWVWLSW